MASAFGDDCVRWTPTEINKLLDCWEKKAPEIGNFQKDEPLAEIARHIGTGKTVGQVRARLKEMKDRYMEERLKQNSKWRFFNRLHVFGNQFTSTRQGVKDRGVKRRSFLTDDSISNMGSPSKMSAPNMGSRSSVNVNPTNRFSDIALESGINKLVQAVKNVGRPQPLTELPPIYPFDSDVKEDVAIPDSWREWNQGLPYQLTDGGIRTLMRSGFRDVQQIALLKTKSAEVSMLHLNYHDKLALQQAMEADLGKTEKFELVTNMEGAVIGIHGSVDASDAILLSDDGLKMLEWNRALAHPLSLRGLAKVLKAGFTTSEELCILLNDDYVDYLDLSLRDKIVLAKYVIKPEEKDGEQEASSEQKST